MLDLIFLLLIAILMVNLSFVLHLIFHEVGHMFFGFVTGWKHIYLQVFRFALLKQKSTYKIKSVSSFAFRCIMYPVKLDSNAVVYTLGGLLNNLVLTILSLFFMIFFFNTKPLLMVFFMTLFVSGISFLIMNAIPNTTRCCNDMACYKLIKNDALTKTCHNKQLLIAKQLYDGVTYGQIDKNLICSSFVVSYNDITAYSSVLEYYYHLDKDEYIKAQDSLNRIDLLANVSKEVRKFIMMERLYIDIVHDLLFHESNINAKENYKYGIDAYIKNYETNGDVHTVRVKAAYEAYLHYMNGKNNKALDIILSTIMSIKNNNYLYSGEVLFCTDQLTCLFNLIWRDNKILTHGE